MTEDFQAADRLRRSGKVEEALALYEKMRGKGADARVAYEVGLTQATFLQNHTLALAQFAEALRLDPTLGDALFYRALSLNALSRHEEAIADLNAAERLGCQQDFVHAHRGEAYESLDKLELAEREYSHGIARNADDEWLLYRRASVRARLGKNVEALDDLDRAIDLTQDYPDQELYQERAEVKFRLGDVEGARRDLEAASEASSKLVDSVRIQAGIRARLAEFPK
jgi:tetratricopeptide (TPR) repeat protein